MRQPSWDWIARVGYTISLALLFALRLVKVWKVMIVASPVAAVFWPLNGTAGMDQLDESRVVLTVKHTLRLWMSCVTGS